MNPNHLTECKCLTVAGINTNNRSLITRLQATKKRSTVFADLDVLMTFVIVGMMIITCPMSSRYEICV
jgi:hypothetical protein